MSACYQHLSLSGQVFNTLIGRRNEVGLVTVKHGRDSGGLFQVSEEAFFFALLSQTLEAGNV